MEPMPGTPQQRASAFLTAAASLKSVCGPSPASCGLGHGGSGKCERWFWVSWLHNWGITKKDGLMVNPIRMKYLVHSDTFSLWNLQINYVGSCSWTHVVALCPKMVFHGPWRSVFLRHVMDDWSQSIGLVSLRGDPKRDLLVGGTSEPSEESVALLNGPISMILAHFGVCLPVMSKFKAASVAKKMFSLHDLAAMMFSICPANLHINQGSIPFYSRTSWFVWQVYSAKGCEFLGRLPGCMFPCTLCIHNPSLAQDTWQLQDL